MFRIDRQNTEHMVTLRGYGKVDMVLSLVPVTEP
jgi:hypothetical protein